MNVATSFLLLELLPSSFTQAWVLVLPTRPGLFWFDPGLPAAGRSLTGLAGRVDRGPAVSTWSM